MFIAFSGGLMRPGINNSSYNRTNREVILTGQSATFQCDWIFYPSLRHLLHLALESWELMSSATGLWLCLPLRRLCYIKQINKRGHKAFVTETIGIYRARNHCHVKGCINKQPEARAPVMLERINIFKILRMRSELHICNVLSILLYFCNCSYFHWLNGQYCVGYLILTQSLMNEQMTWRGLCLTAL